MSKGAKLSAELTALLEREGLDNTGEEIRPIILSLQRLRAKQMNALLFDATDVYQHWKLPIPSALPPVPDPKPNTITWYDPGLSVEEMIEKSECMLTESGQYVKEYSYFREKSAPSFKRFHTAQHSLVPHARLYDRNMPFIELKTKKRRDAGERIADIRELVSLLLTTEQKVSDYDLLGSEHDGSYRDVNGVSYKGTYLHFGTHWAEQLFEIGMVEDVGEKDEEDLQRERPAAEERNAILDKIRKTPTMS